MKLSRQIEKRPDLPAPEGKVAWIIEGKIFYHNIDPLKEDNSTCDAFWLWLLGVAFVAQIVKLFLSVIFL